MNMHYDIGVPKNRNSFTWIQILAKIKQKKKTEKKKRKKKTQALVPNCTEQMNFNILRILLLSQDEVILTFLSILIRKKEKLSGWFGDGLHLKEAL